MVRSFIQSSTSIYIYRTIYSYMSIIIYNIYMHYVVELTGVMST